MTDILIVGAGPAGMAAAIQGAKSGAKITIVDNKPEPGGNIYSGLLSTRKSHSNVWQAAGSTYQQGAKLIDEFMRCGVKYLPQHSLWHIAPDGTIGIIGADGAKSFKAKKIIMATGAQERPMPMTGWTLPGVMGVGSAQILFKNGGPLPQDPIVIIGSGPLPLLYASQVLAMGGKIAAFIEPMGAVKHVAGIKNMRGAWHGKSYLLKGIGYLIKRKLARIAIYKNAKNIQIIGDEFVTAVHFTTDKPHKIKAKTILLHDGVIPNVNPTGAAELAFEQSKAQQSWAAVSDGILHVAGDAGGILGAKAAALTGEKAMLDALGLNVPQKLMACLEKEQKFRTFIDAVYPPMGNAQFATNETIICRCELVTREAIQATLATTGNDPNRLKSALRCGMGPCQGRMCALSVEAIIADQLQIDAQTIGFHRIRSPIIPITLGEFAKLEIAHD